MIHLDPKSKGGSLELATSVTNVASSAGPVDMMPINARTVPISTSTAPSSGL